MKKASIFEVIIIGGSYAGLAAAMALGRALREVLIIDSGKPCNQQTPHSHNFLTQDGTPPADIALAGKAQVKKYPTIHFFDGTAISARQNSTGFTVSVTSGETFRAKKLVFATGIRDLFPEIPGFAESWGISVLHCPYCHGYEVHHQKTAILGNGSPGFEQVKLLSNWTDKLTLLTNGPSALTANETEQLKKHSVGIIETPLKKLKHQNGQLQQVLFKDDSDLSVNVLYSRRPFEQHSALPQSLGCRLTDEGYIQINASQETTIKGIYACGDNSGSIRTVANAVASGTTTGIMINKELIAEDFLIN